MSDDGPQLPRRVASSALLAQLRRYTDARVALGQAGAGLPTRAVLDLALDHARARDAISTPFAADRLAQELSRGPWPLMAESRADTRETYLTRPDLGRQLSDATLERFEASGLNCALCIVVADGLSALAVNQNAVPLVAALEARLPDDRPVGRVILRHGRVAAGDRIALALGAEAVLILIGERPGLSAADSLGAYVTWRPREDTRDSERYCVSNIRTGGLPIDAAADQIARLLERSRIDGRSGVAIGR